MMCKQSSFVCAALISFDVVRSVFFFFNISCSHSSFFCYCWVRKMNLSAKWLTLVWKYFLKDELRWTKRNVKFVCVNETSLKSHSIETTREHSSDEHNNSIHTKLLESPIIFCFSFYENASKFHVLYDEERAKDERENKIKTTSIVWNSETKKKKKYWHNCTLLNNWMHLKHKNWKLSQRICAHCIETPRIGVERPKWVTRIKFSIRRLQWVNWCCFGCNSFERIYFGP